MTRHPCRSIATAFFCTLATAAFASAGRDLSRDLGGSPDPAEMARQIESQSRTAFDAALREYDARVAQAPFDVVDQLRRCRFIEVFVADHEFASFVDELSEQEEHCREAVAQRFPQHPEVLLMQLERSFGEELLSKGTKILERHAEWTPQQLGRLYTMLARAAEMTGQKKKALEYALRALDLDEASDVRTIAATHLADSGDKARAIRILTSPVDGADPEDRWAIVRRMGLLARLGAREETVKLHAQLEGKGQYNHLETGRVLRTAGLIDLARKELQLAADSGEYGPMERRERFRFELEFGTPEAALAAYETWRDQGWVQDPLALNRVALATRSLALPIRPRDLLGFIALVFALAGIAAAAALPVGLVHYRGLARRVRTGDAYPTSGWQLRHAWLALFAFFSASLLALYSGGPMDVSTDPSFDWGVDATPAQLARITMVESFLAIAFLLPLGRLALRHQSAWWGTKWSLGKSVLIGIAVGVAFRLPLLASLLAGPQATSLLGADDPLWKLMTEVRDQFGIAAALWTLGVVAPVLEEFIFRGVLLRTFTAHLGFGWANAAQAALFAAMHLNPAAAVFLFILGAVCGLFAQRSGGLAAAMITHAVFNLIAGLYFLTR